VDVNGLLSGTSPYTATQFFNGMFETPPYPSTWMAGLIENQAGTGNVGVLDPNQNCIKFLKTIMDDITAGGLNVKIVVMVGIDLNYRQNVDAVATLVNYLGGLPSRSTIGGFGWRVEQTGDLSSGGGYTAAQWDAAFAQVRVAVTNAGWPTISYYPQGWHGTATEFVLEGWLDHTNFPQADPISTLDTLTAHFGSSGNVPVIGITHGTDGPGYFNDANGNMQTNLGCEGISGFGSNNGWPNWQNQAMTTGYLPSPAPPGAVACAQNWPAIIDYVMSRDAANPLADRQWDFWIAGGNAAGYYASGNFLPYIGVSGKTNAVGLWDSPAFRGAMANWLAAHPGIYLVGDTP
jgi:hypothetical protein